MEISFLADISVTTEKINSNLPEMLYVSLLFPGRNSTMKPFRRFLEPHFSSLPPKGTTQILQNTIICITKKVFFSFSIIYLLFSKVSSKRF